MSPLELRIACVLIAAFPACGPRAWVKSEAEPTLVDRHQAGIEVYDQLVLVAEKLLAANPELPSAQGKKVVAFIGVDNYSAEEMAENQESLYQKLDTVLAKERAYTLLSRHYVETALRSRGLRSSDLLLPAGRDEFAEAVRAEGMIPDFLLHGTFSSASSEGIRQSERDYLLTLELIDAHSGRQVAKETAQVRKGYKK